MSANKYVELSAGQLAEKVATVTSAGAGNKDEIVALDATGRLDLSVMPIGIGPDTAMVEASEDLVAGNFVNIHDSTGAKVRKADCTNGRRAHGFVLAGVTAGDSALVYFEGVVTGKSGLTPGATLYLDAAGVETATAPVTVGHIVQEIGAAASATTITFEPQRPVTLA